MSDMPQYSETAMRIALHSRLSILRMTHKAKASHVGSSLSVVDILSTLYSGFLSLGLDGKDRFILSKGHAAAALYAVLAEVSLIPHSWLDTYCNNGAALGGHVTSEGVPGVILSTGSLGHGLPYAVGIAQGIKMNQDIGRVFVVISDGECDEGTTWESALIASQFKLDNLCLIIDRNRIQSLGPTEDTIGLEPLDQKWESFGWDVRVVDGHNYIAIENALEKTTKPLVVIANTIKGKGVSFMENSVLWHYKSPNEENFKIATDEINAGLR